MRVISLEGPAVNISIRTVQMDILARAAEIVLRDGGRNTPQFDFNEWVELEGLAQLFREIIANPGKPGDLHGIAL